MTSSADNPSTDDPSADGSSEAPGSQAPSSGVLIVDKPRGPSSFAIVAGVRKLYGTRRVGHCGTLDPMASGVLVVVIGEATKLSGVLTGAAKRYTATISFGANTDSLDAEGAVVERRALVSGWSAHAPLTLVLEQERQRTSQVPPQFSAIKRAGRKAYQLARRGEHQELAERAVQLTALHCLSFDDHALTLDVHASKGYYVRALARDVCAALGVCGHLSALRRVASGCFSLADARPWPLARRAPLLPMAHAVERAMPVAELTELGVEKARLGHALGTAHFLAPPADDVHAWLSPERRLVALGQREGEGYRVTRGIHDT